MQPGNLPTSFSQIPAADLMQHYFSTINLYKKDNKRSQNLSLGSQSMKAQNSQRNTSINNSKAETNNSQIKTSSQAKIPSETPSKTANGSQAIGLSYKTSDKQKIPISKTQRSGQSPINQSGNKLKFAPQLHKQKSLTIKSSQITTKHQQDPILLNLKQQQQPTKNQNLDRPILLNKENIHNNILDQLTQNNIQSQMSNQNYNTITNKIQTINSTLPKSARQHSNVANQCTSFKEVEHQKSQTLKDINEMKYFKGQLAITSQLINRNSKEANQSSNQIYQDMKQQQNSKESSDELITFTNLYKKYGQQDQNQLNTETNCLSTEPNYLNTENNQNEHHWLTTETGSLPNSSAERSASSMKLLTKSDEDYQQDSLYCQKHPNKKGKYIASSKVNGKKSIICSRCAIDLASQRYIIEEIFNDNTQNQMKQIMQQLISEVQENKEYHEKMLTKVSFKKDQLYSFYIKSASLVENVFLKIERQLIEKKNTILNELNKQKIQNENTYSLIEQEAKEILNELNQISNDILLHHDSILQSIELEPFNIIIQNYKQKIKIINDYFQDLQRQTIPLMKVSSECSNKIVEQIFQVQQYQTTLLKKNDKNLNQNKTISVKSKSIQNNGVEENKQKQEENIQNNINSFEPSQASTEEQIQEDEKIQIQASPVQQRIDFQQLLSQQQGNQINQNKIDYQIKNINQQTKSSLEYKNNNINNKSIDNHTKTHQNQSQIRNNQEQLIPSIIPISQTTSIIVKSQSSLAQQLGLKNGSLAQYPLINSLNQMNNNGDENFMITPDIFHKKIKFNNKINTDDTPIAGLYNNNNINFNENDFQQQNQYEQNKQQQINNQYQQYIQQAMLQQQHQFQNQMNVGNQQDIYLNNQNAYQFDKHLDQFNQNIGQLDTKSNLKNSSGKYIDAQQDNNKNNNMQLLNNIQGQQQNKCNNYRFDTTQLSNFLNNNNSNNMGQDSLKQDSLNEQKQQSSAFRALFSSQIKDKIIEEPLSSGKSNSGNEKYKNILEKIHANQARNNNFYSDLMKTGSVSPKMQNAQSPSNETQFNYQNDHRKTISVPQFTLSSNDSQIAAFGIKQNVIPQQNNQNTLQSQQSIGQNIVYQKQNNRQYDQDSNNFTINNSLINEDDENLLKDDEDLLNDDDNLMKENYHLFRDENNFKMEDKTNQNYNQKHNFNNNSINNFTPTKNQSLKNQNNNKIQSDSFSLCIQRYPKTQTNQITQNIPNEYFNNNIQVDSSNSLQVVQKSYSQLFGNKQTRESFATNSYLQEGNSIEFRASDFKNSYPGLEQLNRASNQFQNNQNIYQIQHDINNINGNNCLTEQQLQQQKYLIYLQQQNQISNFNNHTFNNTQDTQAQMNNSKEQKGFRDFINFLENKIEEENTIERAKNKSDYRKTLFFSPKFNSNCDEQQQQNNQIPSEYDENILTEEMEKDSESMHNDQDKNYNN